MKCYIVATNTDYTVLLLAESKEQAVEKADIYYQKEYGESRYDWEAYEIESYLDPDEVMPIRSWKD